MGKTRHAREDEFYKEQIRHLKKEVKRKDQEIKRLQKELGYNQTKSPANKETEEDRCPQCGKGLLIHSDLIIRRLTTCSLCPFRQVLK